MFAVMKKELKSYFLTPIGYIFIGVCLLTFSLFFYISIFDVSLDNYEYLFYNGATTLTLFIIPVLTMGMFANERKSGTEQLILTSPRSITAIVFGKFCAAGIVLLISDLLTLIYYVILDYFGNPSLLVSMLTLFGFFLLGLAYISFGMFASSITENQIVSCIITVVAFLIFWFLPVAVTGLEMFSLVNIFTQYFPSGLFSIQSIITYITFIALFISLTIVVLQRRKNIK